DPLAHVALPDDYVELADDIEYVLPVVEKPILLGRDELQIERIGIRRVERQCPLSEAAHRTPRRGAPAARFARARFPGSAPPRATVISEKPPCSYQSSARARAAQKAQSARAPDDRITRPHFSPSACMNSRSSSAELPTGCAP